MPVLVVETLLLRPPYRGADGAARVGREYERLLHQNAHGSVGYTGHASFHFEAPDKLVVVYPWSDEPSLRALLAAEGPLLVGFLQEYCVGARAVRCLERLDVENC